MYDVLLSELDDPEAFRSSKEYVDNYTSRIEGILEDFGKHTDGALTCYIRYNPEFTEPTSGLFLSRSNSESEFEHLTPTDFSMYVLQNLIEKETIYDNAYSMMLNSSNAVMIHPELELGTSLEAMNDSEINKLLGYINQGDNQNSISYSYQGQEKLAYATNLQSG